MRMLPVVPLAAALLLGLGAPALATHGERAAVSVAVPREAELGQTVEVQARVTDAAGIPIPRALVLFVARVAFLSAESDAVLADARTDESGIATAQFEARTEGTLLIRAVFEGDQRYDEAIAESELAVVGHTQLFAEHAGVRLPGLNAGPAALPMFRDGTPVVGLIQGTSRLWPLVSGWPIALALMIVWSLYVSVVLLLFRITAAAKEERA